MDEQVRDPLDELRAARMGRHPDRDWCTAFLREMQRQANGRDWLDRSTWPADLRNAYEEWEASELARKAADPTRRPAAPDEES